MSAASASLLKTLASISRLHIVAIAVLGNFTFGWIFTGRYPWLLAAICGLDWMLVNLLNRVVDLPEDQANRITGTDFVARHKRAITVLGFGVLFASLLGFPWFFPAEARGPLLFLRLFFHTLGFAYNYPILPFGRIKALYFWKNTASAVGFLITVFGYPLVVTGGALAPGISWATVLVSVLFFFPFELSYEVIYDLRDISGDAAEGIRTYPVVHGKEGAARIIDGLLFGSMAVLVVGYAGGAIPWRIFIMICAPLIQYFYYKKALRRGISAEDCIFLTWLGAGLLFVYHIWVLLGLPGAG